MLPELRLDDKPFTSWTFLELVPLLLSSSTVTVASLRLVLRKVPDCLVVPHHLQLEFPLLHGLLVLSLELAIGHDVLGDDKADLALAVYVCEKVPVELVR